jgi:hypothetical protein
MDVRGAREADRFMLWIDAVGGYWVCLGNAITIGQPSRPMGPDVPILGDLSSCHARLRRDGEGFLIEAMRETLVDGRPVQNVDWLRDGSQIQLGDAVRLLFRRPHALSGTARLDFVSRHRTQPSTDAVLWMADCCVLGPKQRSHVVCRKWTREVMLCREENGLVCRTAGTFEIDGTTYRECGPISHRSHVRGEGFSFNLEAA